MNTLRKKVLYVVILSLVVLVIIVASSKRNNPDKDHTYSRVLMGTVVELTLSGGNVDRRGVLCRGGRGGLFRDIAPGNDL